MCFKKPGIMKYIKVLIFQRFYKIHFYKLLYRKVIKYYGIQKVKH